MAERFANGSDTLVQLVEGFAPRTGTRSASHRSATSRGCLLFGHTFWDSWLHERDMFVPLDRTPSVVPDELLAVTCFCLLFAGLQAGSWTTRG